MHVLAPAEFGGLESVVRVMAAGQRRRGDDVVVMPLLRRGYGSPSWLDALRAESVSVEPLVSSRFGYLAQLRELTRRFARRMPAVLHTHGYQADVIAGWAGRRAGLPTVATVHGFVGGGPKNRLYEWLQRRALRRFDAVMPVSRAMAAGLRGWGVPAARLHVVPNAFEPAANMLSRDAARARLGLRDGYFHVGWIGRLSPEKGPDVMLRALALTDDAAVRLSVIGDGAERSRLAALAAALGVAGRVSWHGVVPDAATLLGAFDAVALSSRTEGTPIVLLEAMAAGVPAIATAVGGVPDVVSAAEAVLVPAEDPGALAAAVESVRTEPAAAAGRVGAARRRLGEQFSVEPWLDRVDEVYRAAREAAVRARS